MFGSGFGSNTSTFGGGTFGGTANPGGGVFGQQAQPQPTTSLFGGASAFGTATQQSLPVFGGAGSAGTGGFGSPANTTSVFGQQARPTTGIFSSTANTISPFGTQTQHAGTSIPFNAITGTDTMMKNGAASQINTRHQCITCMKEYENKSLEELRMEDYQLNRKGPQNPMFGGATPQQQPQQSGGLFSGMGATSTAGTTSFGQTSAFGQTSTPGGLFGSLNQPKAGGFFGSGATPTSTAFGGGPSLGFSFSNPTSQPQASIFGSNNNAVTSTTAGLGTSAFSFSQPQQQQQSGLGLFGQKPLTTPASTAPAFGGGFGGATNTTLNKPLFGGGQTGATTFGAGTAAPTFGTGTGSLFSTNTTQQPAKPFSFTTPFNATAQPTSQPTFGGTTSGTSTFSFSNPVSAPSVNFGGGATTAPTFGGGTPGTTGSTFGAPLSFSLGGTTNQQPQVGTGTSFGSGFFSSGTNQPPGSTGLSLFSGTGANTFNTGGNFQLQQQQQLQMQQQQQQQQQNTISFATTPYKDNKLFYNLISNRKVEDLSKPTNPLAQRQFREASRRKTSTSIGAMSNITLSTNPALKNLTFPVPTKNNSISKFQIFDGFEDEERCIGIDVLLPKTSVKKLVLKTDNIMSSPSMTPGGSIRRLSLSIAGASPLTRSINLSSLQSPTNALRRTRLTLNSTLNTNDNSYLLDGEPNRTIEFGDSILENSLRGEGGTSFSRDNNHNNSGSSDGNLNNSGNSGAGDFGNINGLPPDHIFGNAASSSKRGSEVEIVNTNGSITGSPSQYLNGPDGLSDGSGGSICGLVCTRPGYFIKPSVELLDRMTDPNGNCIVKGFEVGRHNFGKIRFLDAVNVANINIDEIVLFRHKEVVVYPDDSNKPPLGQGLNCPAEIELERVWPIDKSSNDSIRSPGKIKALNYETKLRRACARLESEYISYNEELGTWKFKVDHFSKYSCEVEENEEDDLLPPPMPGTSKGLGGITMAQQQKQMQQQQRVPGGPPMPILPPVHQPGPGGDAMASMPMNRMSLPVHFTATLPVSQMPSTDSRFSLMEGPSSDVELNPLTPCDSDEDDDDDDDEDEEEEHLVMRRPSTTSRLMVAKYKPILKDSGSEKSRMLKSVMSIDEIFDGDSSITASSDQPPMKKSKAPGRVSFAAHSFVGMPNMETDTDMNLSLRLRGRLSLGQQQEEFVPISSRPTPMVVALQPCEYHSVKEKVQEDLFSSLRSQTTPLKLKGCPRVCFAPNGHIISVNQGVTSTGGFQAQLKISQFASYADKQSLSPISRPWRNVLEKQMQFRLQRDSVIFRDHIKTLRDEMQKCSVPHLRLALEEELVVWQLCDILWPQQEDHIDDDPDVDMGIALEQRQNLSEWLRKYAPILFGGVYDNSDKTILGLMKKGMLEEACLMAMQQGNDMMAVVLASEAHLTLFFQDCPDVLEFMPKDTADIFALCAGILGELSSLTAERVTHMNTHDWWQFFALFLWYHGPVKSALPTPVDRCVKEFEEMMRGVVSDDEFPLPATETSTVANLCMHLMKMYCCTGYPMNIVLSPRTGSLDCLDYKLPWLLMQDMEYIGYLPGDDIYSALCLGFTGQLEATGFWKWSQFVLQSLPAPEVDEELEESGKQARDVFCQRLLEKNISVGDQSSLQNEQFIVYQLGIDEKIIYSIKTWKTKRVDELLSYFGKIGNWQLSYDIFINYMFNCRGMDMLTSSITGFAENSLKHLQILEENKSKIVGWDLHGKMIYNYMTMCESRKQNTKSVTEAAAVKFLESIIKFVPSNSKECAFFLDLVLKAQKIIQVMLGRNEVQPDIKAVIQESLVSFLDMPVPKEYFDGLRCFINSTMMMNTRFSRVKEIENIPNVDVEMGEAPLVPANSSLII